LKIPNFSIRRHLKYRCYEFALNASSEREICKKKLRTLVGSTTSAFCGPHKFTFWAINNFYNRLQLYIPKRSMTRQCYDPNFVTIPVDFIMLRYKNRTDPKLKIPHQTNTVSSTNIVLSMLATGSNNQTSRKKSESKKQG